MTRLSTFLLPALAAALVYLDTLGNGFVYDDPWTLARPDVWQPGLIDLLLERRGVTFAFHRLDFWIWGRWAPGFHATNLLLHAAASAVVAVLAHDLSRSNRVALLCGLLFAVHPIHVDAIAPFANRGDPLAMIFGGASVLLWRSARRMNALPMQSWPRYVGSLALLAIAIYAKEASAIGIALMLPLSDWLLERPASGERPPVGPLFLRWAPFAVVGVVAVMLFTGDLLPYFQEPSILLHSEGALHSYPEVLATVAGAVPDAFRLLAFPWTLSFDYPLEPHRSFAELAPAFGLVLVGAWLALAIAFEKSKPLVTFAAAWVVLTYLPSTNVFPIIHHYLAERFLYVPSFGFCLLVALAFDQALRESERRAAWLRWGIVGLFVLTTLLAGTRTVVRNRDWRSETALATSALEAGIETRRIHHMLGEAALAEADTGRAVRHYARSVELKPDVAWIRYDLATALTLDGKLGEADRQFAIAAAPQAELGPKAITSLYHLGMASLSRDDPVRAGRAFDRALVARPGNDRMRTALVAVRATSIDDEARDVDAALQLARPARTPWGECGLALALAARGEREQARAVGERAAETASRLGSASARSLATAVLALLDADEPLLRTGPQLHALLAR